MKVATHVLLFGQDKWIMRNIANAYPHVDKIYIAYSRKPWLYNLNARNQYDCPFDLNKIYESPYADKVTIIEGVWDTEEQQRNACAERAVEDGMEYLIIHDADEFYFHNTFKRAIKAIKENPDFDYYKIGWLCFWKTFNHVLLGRDRNMIVGYPEFAINLKRGVRFQSKRRPTHTYFKILEDDMLCYHGSYVLTNEELIQKINTWGHTNDFNKDYWYNEKWLKWSEQSTDLHLVTPQDWSKAVKYEGILPEVIADMK